MVITVSSTDECRHEQDKEAIYEVVTNCELARRGN